MRLCCRAATTWMTMRPARRGIGGDQPPPGTEAAAPVRQAPADAARLPSVQRLARLRSVYNSGRCGVALAVMRQGRACRVGSSVRPCPTPGRGRGQVFVVSSDGAQVPMFIVAPINITLDGNNPTMLYGYGVAPPCLRRPCEGARQLCMLCERCAHTVLEVGRANVLCGALGRAAAHNGHAASCY